MAKTSIGGKWFRGTKEELAAPSGFLRLPAELSNKADWTDADIIKAENVLVSDASSRLPSLEGTERQVSWAEDIRASGLRQMSQLYSMIRGGRTHDYQRRQLLPEGTSRTEALTAIQTGMRNFTQNKSAKWWIDNRDRVNSVAVHINAQR